VESGDKQRLLTSLAAEAEALGASSYDQTVDAQLYRLRDRASAAACELFGAGHWLALDMAKIAYAPTVWPASKLDYQAALLAGTSRLAGLLRAAAEGLAADPLTPAQLASHFGLGAPVLRPAVLVSHGTDEGMLAAVCRALDSMGLEAVVLHTAGDATGSRVLQMLAQHPYPVFGVVLLAPRDLTARPATFIELGYCWGKLGLERVLCFVRADAGGLVPANYLGGNCRIFDDHGAWQELLRQALARAGAI
jgi:hypothetical protein